VLLGIALAMMARLVIMALSGNPYMAVMVGLWLVPYVTVTVVFHRRVRRTLRTLEKGDDPPPVTRSEWMALALAAAGLLLSLIP
jgi:hypothetical protein